METFSALLSIGRGLHRSRRIPLYPHKGQWGWALVFSLITAWTNSWVNNQNAGDLRRHHAHYDATVIYLKHSSGSQSADTVPLISMSICRSQLYFKSIVREHCGYGVNFDVSTKVPWQSCCHLSVINYFSTWWRHQMETFSALLAPLCGEFTAVTGDFPAQRPEARSFDIFFDLRQNKRLSKQSSAGDFRRHRVHYDITVMQAPKCMCLTKRR